MLVRDSNGNLIHTTQNHETSENKMETKTSAYDIVHTYSNHKKDNVFKWVDVEPLNAISAIHSMGADGNCGFRAVSFGVYHDQARWVDVKDAMLVTYSKYKDTLYKVIGSDTVVEYEEIKMMARLASRKSPCLFNQDLWFTSFTCPQIVADTYQRSVILYCYVENITKAGEKRINYESQIFYPLINMEFANFNNPITLLLAFSHFYYVEFGRTPKGRMKKFKTPALNMDHIRLRNSFPDICNATDFSVLL